MESAGVADVLTKIVGSRNPFNVVRATFDAIDRLMTKGQVEGLRGVGVGGEVEPEEPEAPAAPPIPELAGAVVVEEGEKR
jgi:small subunit ribosomal protein S5